MKKPSERLIPFVLSYKKFEEEGLKHIDPHLEENFNFSQALLMLDHGSFSDVKMEMPRWVFYDCAIMPGVVSGYGIYKEHLDADIKNYFKLDMPFYPCAMSIMIPMMEEGSYFAHNLCSINAMLPGKFKSVARYSKALSLELTKTKILYGATKWNSDAMFVHLRFGELELVSSVTYLHGEKFTLTYKTLIQNPWKFRDLNSLGSNFKIKCDDLDAQKKIQEDLKHSLHRYVILHRDGDDLFLRKD